MTTTVVNARRVTDPIPNVNYVYVGRPSKWGNPFRIGKDGTREEVIAKYREWVQRQPALMDSLHELRGMRLGCYCFPLDCHADVLAELAEKGAERGDSERPEGGSITEVGPEASDTTPWGTQEGRKERERPSGDSEV